MPNAETTRNIAFAILGAVGLVLKPAYRGHLQHVVHAYGGNFPVSFGLYFAAISAAKRFGFGQLAAAIATLLAVEAFELTNGFGVMVNSYDPIDLMANAVGVGIAVVVDVVSSRLLASKSGATIVDHRTAGLLGQCRAVQIGNNEPHRLDRPYGCGTLDDKIAFFVTDGQLHGPRQRRQLLCVRNLSGQRDHANQRSQRPNAVSLLFRPLGQIEQLIGDTGIRPVRNGTDSGLVQIGVVAR